MKLNKESDLDWSEIAEKNELDISADHLRKMAYGVKLVADSGLLKSDSSDEEMLAQIKIEKQKVRDIRRDITSQYALQARSEAMRESIKNAVRELEPIEVETEVLHTIESDSKEKELLLCISDMHYGAEWKIEGLNGEIVNEYNPEIFERRMCGILAQAAEITKVHDIKNIKVLLGGDSLDGILRNSQLMKLRYGIIESAMRYSEFMAQWLAILCKRHNVEVYSVDGNHTEIRPLGSSRGEFENENIEKIIMWYLAERLKNIPNIKVDEKATKHKLIDSLGCKILLAHGDESGSLQQILTETILLYGNPIDIAIVGHKHREQSVICGYNKQGSTYIMRTPSVCGMDSFARQKRMGGGAGAMGVIIEKGYGRKCEYPIRVD